MFPLISIQYHLLSSSSLIFFVSNCNTNCKRSVHIQLRKEGGLPKWFPPAKNETHMRPLPIYWFDGIMFLPFAMWFVGQIDDWLTFWDFITSVFQFNESAIKMFLQKSFWYNDWSFTICRNDKIISKSENQTVSQNPFSIDNLAILKLWKIQIIFSSKKSLHWKLPLFFKCSKL